MSALRRAAVRVSLAAAIASGFAGAAAAQFKIEPIGDWDRVSVENLAVFVAAVPNTRAARAYWLGISCTTPAMSMRSAPIRR